MTDVRRGAPNEVTRVGGLCGIAAAGLTVVRELAAPVPSVPLDGVLSLATAFTGLYFMGALIDRHRGSRWHWRWCAGVLALGFVVLTLGLAAEMSPIPGAVLMGGAGAALLLGLLVAGIVPRGAVLLLAAAVVLEALGLDTLATVLSAVASAWIGYGLWREPVSPPARRTAPASPGRG